MALRSKKSRFSRWKRAFTALVIIGVILLAGLMWSRHIYNRDLGPVSNNQATQLFTIKQGASVQQIADDLKQAHLIKSSWAFQLYVRSKGVSAQLEAGTYALSPSQSAADIIGILDHGKVTTKLVTILPGRRIDQVRADLINDGFAPAAVDQALNPAVYSDVPLLSIKPAAVNTMEGLLWPDSYQKQPDTDPSVIIHESLNEMSQHLTPTVEAAFENEGLTTYQGITLASIIDQEVSKPGDQGQAAQVFLSRLRAGMVLGSDVTANYGAIAAGRSPSLNYDSPYNTLLHPGLPPSPISAISQSSLYASTHPAGTSWLYFVTGDDGTTHFSTTLQQQQANTAQYCHKLCGQ